MSEPKTDLDSPWKEILEYYFTEFVAFFFPEVHADIDWQSGYEFLDKELQQVTHDAELGRRYADKLIKVWRKSGEEQWVIIHLEVQNQPESDFSKRMYVYNYRLFDRFERVVVSLALLTDNRTKWRPKHFGYDLWGCKVRFEFPSVKLRDYRLRWEELETSSNPFAVVVMAHLKTQDTQRNTQERELWKLQLTRRLYERGYERQDILNLFRFIDWIMRLPHALEQDFWRQMSKFEEERKMRYITSVERIGMQQGLQQGLQQGGQRHVLRVLQHRFGSVPETIKVRMSKLTVEQLEELLDVALEVNSLAEFIAKIPPVVETETNPH